MNNFLSFLGSKYPNVSKMFEGKKPGTSSFNQAWKTLANQQPEQFEQMQHGFIQSTHYDPASISIKNKIGLDVNQRSKALQDVLWSTSVQHGAGGASKIFRNALSNWKNMTEKQMINAIYDERSKNNGMAYFPSSSSNIRNSVLNRFKRERKDALSMLS